MENQVWFSPFRPVPCWIGLIMESSLWAVSSEGVNCKLWIPSMLFLRGQAPRFAPQGPSTTGQQNNQDAGIHASSPRPCVLLSRWRPLRWCCCPAGVWKTAWPWWRNRSGSPDSGLLLLLRSHRMWWSAGGASSPRWELRGEGGGERWTESRSLWNVWFFFFIGREI